MKNEVNRALVAEKKRQYIIPLMEVQPMESASGIMKTSIDLLPDMGAAPRKRWTEVF